MNPHIWGPHAWIFLHSISITYPDNPDQSTQLSAKNLILSLKELLPCEHCKKNYEEHIKNLSDDIFTSKKKFFKFLVDLHNKVNKLNGKREYSYEEVINIYKRKCMSSSPNFFIYLLFITMIVVLFYLILKKQ